MPSTKTFVLDTSVLLYNASSIRSFGSKDVVIPYVVLEELDKFKTRDGVVGRNARQVARELNELRKEGPLNEGVQVTPIGGRLRIELNYHTPESDYLEITSNDCRILNVCLGLMKTCPKVVLVTKDINLAVRADVLGIEAQDFDSDRLVKSASEIYSGTRVITVPDEAIEAFYRGEDVRGYFDTFDYYPNEYLTLVSATDGRKTALSRVSPNAGNALVKIKRYDAVWGISPRNREQQFALDALLDVTIPLVTLTGCAGTGKTLCALACALQQVQDDGVYDRLIVSRPVQPLGRDIGFLPGNTLEKMDPWMGPIKDALEYLTRDKSRRRGMYDEMVSMGMLEVEPLTYIRGRSLPNTLFILDEAQDMTRPEIKTMVSRMGEGSKLVLIGDVMQVSNPYLDATNNGLSNVIEKFKSSRIAAHVTLSKGERSELATTASAVL